MSENEKSEMLLGTLEMSFETFLIFIIIIPDPLVQITFTHKVLDSQFKKTRFLESDQK